MAIPVINIFMFLFFVFGEWPILKQSKSQGSTSWKGSESLFFNQLKQKINSGSVVYADLIELQVKTGNGTFIFPKNNVEPVREFLRINKFISRIGPLAYGPI